MREEEKIRPIDKIDPFFISFFWVIFLITWGIYPSLTPELHRLNIVGILLPDPRGAGHVEASQFLSVCLCVCPSVSSLNFILLC